MLFKFFAVIQNMVTSRLRILVLHYVMFLFLRSKIVKGYEHF